MATCSSENCSHLPEYILWDFNYQTYCEHHKITTPQKDVYKLKDISLDLLLSFIGPKYSMICGKIGDIITESLSSLQLKKLEIEQAIIHVEKISREYNNIFNKIFETTPIDSKLMIDATINNFIYIDKNISKKPLIDLEYIKTELEKLQKSSSEIIKYRDQFSRPEDENKPTLSDTMKERNQNLEIAYKEGFKTKKVVYVNSNFNIEMWKVEASEKKEYFLKRVEKLNERSIKILNDEMNLLMELKHTGLFVPIILKGEDEKFIWYYKNVNKPNLSKLLKSRNWIEKEIWEFFEFIKYFVNTCSGKIRNYILEPKSISFTNDHFCIQDIMYTHPDQIEKYMSPEYKNKDPNSSSSTMVIYSAGMIILEMLKIDINGFNKNNLYMVLVDKIQSLTDISQKLKEVISLMVHFDASKRINKQTIYQYKSNNS